jgi:hypothetical protein
MCRGMKRHFASNTRELRNVFPTALGVSRVGVGKFGDEEG